MTHILPFTPKRPVLPSQPLPRPQAAAAPVSSNATAIDLSGKLKCLFFIGRGRIGKTTAIRVIAETMAERGGEAVVAAVDPVNRSLRAFLDGVAEPKSTDPEGVKDWLYQLLQSLIIDRRSGLIDLGGGDTSLTALLADMPDLADIMADGGVEPVAIHIVGTDPHDLTPLATTEAAGFRPRATAIVLNEVHGRRATDFDQILQHPSYQQAIDRGAIQLWMPLLTPDAARVIDANNWHYLDVKGKLGPFHASSVHQWLRRVGEDFAPISSWYPEAAQ